MCSSAVDVVVQVRLPCLQLAKTKSYLNQLVYGLMLMLSDPFYFPMQPQRELSFYSEEGPFLHEIFFHPYLIVQLYKTVLDADYK